MFRNPQAIIAILLLAPPLVSTLTAGEADVKKTLSGHGIRVLGSNLSLTDESKLTKAHREVTKLKKTLLNTNKQLNAIQRRSDFNKKTISQLRLRHIQFSAQLVKVSPNNVTLNNKLVGALNAIKGQMDLLSEQQDRFSKEAKGTRAKMIEAREKYIQHVLDMRELTDDISRQYTEKAANTEIKTALAELKQATGKEFKLTPSRGFQSSVRKLKLLEDSVLSESIELRNTGNNSLYVPVVINGKHTKEMIVDSGATLISLPHGLAVECGIEPSADSPDISLRLANGAVISGKLVSIKEVRVGKFIVKNVECVVLGREATEAEPLLGMSFLGNFKFEINAQAGTLTMVKVETSTRRKSSRLKR